MNKLYIFILMLSSLSLYCQDNDRFLRLYGVASHELVSDDLRVYFSVFEVKENAFKKGEPKAFEDSYNSFKDALLKGGFALERLQTAPKKIDKYFLSTRSEDYYIDIKRTEDISMLYFKKDDGFDVDKTLFVFEEREIEAELSIKAISNAKRKAQIICDKLGLKLGKIKSIEDQSSGCCNEFLEKNTSSTKLEYKVTVTFEILD